jgi:hypothetical protein
MRAFLASVLAVAVVAGPSTAFAGQRRYVCRRPTTGEVRAVIECKDAQHAVCVGAWVVVGTGVGLLVGSLCSGSSSGLGITPCSTLAVALGNGLVAIGSDLVCNPSAHLEPPPIIPTGGIGGALATSTDAKSDAPKPDDNVGVPVQDERGAPVIYGSTLSVVDPAHPDEPLTCEPEPTTSEPEEPNCTAGGD